MFSGKKPDCYNCPPNGYVLALPENYDVLEVIDTYGHTLIDGEGSIRLSEISYALELCGKEASESNIRKIVIYLSTAVSIRHKELKDGQKNRTGIHNQGQGDGTIQKSVPRNPKAIQRHRK